MAAAADGQLAARRQRTLDRHLAGCGACRDELVRIERVLGAVAALPLEAAVPARLEEATLRRIRIAAAEEAERGRWRRWAPVALPAFAAAGVAAVAVSVTLLRSAPMPSPPAAPGQVARTGPAAPEAARATAVEPRVPIAAEPPAEPPAALAELPDLFIELPILRHMEKLQHFEEIRTTTPGAPLPRSSGEEQSNG
jgi:hypothetical protein